MCLGAKVATSADVVEVNQADLFQKKLTQTTAASSTTPSVAAGSDADDHDSSALSDTSSVNIGDEMTQEDSLVVKAPLPISELERVHGKCTQKWRQLSAQRKAAHNHQRNPKGDNAERPLPTPRPSQEAAPTHSAECAAPRGGSSTKSSKKHVARHGSRQSRLDSIRRRHAQCITALKSTVEAKKEANRRASDDASAKPATSLTSTSTLAEILAKTVQIQETQEYLRQNLDLKAHYEALKALNEALLSELESCRQENTELYEQIAILEGHAEVVSPQSDREHESEKQQELDEEKESEKEEEASQEELEDVASSSDSETVLAPCSGLTLMSPYRGWARLISN